MFEQVQRAGLPHGSSLDLDFHTAPAHTATEPLEKHYVSSRSRRQQGIGFLTLRRRSRWTRGPGVSARLVCWTSASRSRAMMACCGN